MSDLTEGGKALVHAARQADRPSEADRERVLALLRERLGDAALLATTAVQAPSAASRAALLRSKLLKWGWVGPTVLVAGAAVWFAPHAGQQRQAAPAASASVLSAPAAPSAAAEVAPSPSAQVVDGTPTRAESAEGASRAIDPQKTPRARDSLAEEVALLSRAETELHAGRPAKALVVLAEHQRKFPRGALAEERTAARIQALCALGRTEEANAQLRQLLHISPKSPQEERARQACRATP
ncbi:MAG TPA: hypothetical protein VFK05_25240 [Polyangiaceae bacterium]|nr:hypothetical protein [Polyangiaceae bacterium]